MSKTDGRTYICIDLKSFYASVECAEAGLDPMTAKLVVADPERGDKTICLAVSPALKKLGVKNRCRVFEIPENIEYIKAAPRMKRYIDYSAEIYGIYLKYISKDDIHVYSIDECFMDVTKYLKTYRCSAKELAKKLMGEVYSELGIRAACGIGSNLYLAKIALDITAKHAEDFIGELNEKSYIQRLWDHKPITDFWRIGPGTARRLERYGITTMRQIAAASEDLIYRVFGKDGELLIDHAWGREPVTIEDIKKYRTQTSLITSGQVLMRDYSYEEGKIIVREMADELCLDLVDKGLITKSVTMTVGYSNSLKCTPANGTEAVKRATSSDKILIPAAVRLYERITDKEKPVRRLNISFNNVVDEALQEAYQTTFFDDGGIDDVSLMKSKNRQKAVIGIKKRYGKNAILKGTDFENGATARERNHQIGGHKSGE